MAKPPAELKKQIQVMEEMIDNLNDLIDTKKIKVQYYGKDFLEPLGEIREEALSLRNKLEVFKNNLEYALTAQYTESERFASEKPAVSYEKVIDRFLSRRC